MWAATMSEKGGDVQRLISEEMSGYEEMLYVMALAEFITEVSEYRAQGPTIYRQELWNLADVFMIIMWLIMYLLRTDVIAMGTGNLFLTCFTFNSNLLFFRLLKFTYLSSRLGPMARAVYYMCKDVVNVSLLLALIIVGFSASMYAIYGVNEDVAVFQGFGSSLATMWSASLGGGVIDDVTGDLSSFDNQLGFFMVSTYMFLIIVVVLNMVVALMSATYETVKARSGEEHANDKTRLLWQCDQATKELPPPFNLLILLLYVAVTLVYHIYLFFLDEEERERRKKDKGTGTWRCKYCHQYVPESTTERLVTQAKCWLRDRQIDVRLKLSKTH